MTTNVTHLCSRPEVDRPFDRWPSVRSIERRLALTPVAHGGRYRVDVASFLSFRFGLVCFPFACGYGLEEVKSPAVPPELAEEKDWKLKRGALRGAVSTTVDLAGSQALVVSLAAGS